MTRHLRLLAGLVSSALVLAACSDSSDEGGSEKRTDASTSATERAGGAATSATPPTCGPQAGAFTAAVAKRLGQQSVPDSAMRGPGGSVGTWKGTEVGVLTKGEDTTLVVRGRGKGDWRIVGGWWPSKKLPGPYLGGKRHILMVGSDARPNQKITRSRADAIQVVGLDGTGGGGILGIPRDTRTALPGGRSGKINAAMARGGRAAQKSTVARLTGLPLTGYLVTGFKGFSATVDALGGVEVTLTRPIRHLKPGTHKLKGADLLWVARERKTLPRGDIDRSSNQGMVLFATLTTLRERGVGRLPTLMTKTSRHFRTDLSPAEVLTLLANGYALNPSRVGRAVADTRPAGPDLALTRKAKQTFARFGDGNL